MIKKCAGCGLTIQYDNENKLGYSPKKDAKFCERCFKLKNYNQKVNNLLKYSNDQIIDIINKKADVVYFITDFLNLSNLVIDLYNKINKEKILIINKSDYIPNSINQEKYINWVKEVYKIETNIILVSCKRNYNINRLNNLIKNNKNNYFCGFTNSGKSTIIKNLSLLNNKNIDILSSLMPNTTLDIIKVKLDDNLYIYDTPGFDIKDDFDEKLYPKNYLKPITIQTKPGDVLNVGDRFYIRTDENKNSFTFYMSDQIKVNKVYDVNFDTNSFEIDSDSDLFISSFGFINIKNKCSIKISKIDNYIEIRNSIF